MTNTYNKTFENQKKIIRTLSEIKNFKKISRTSREKHETNKNIIRQ